MINLSYFHLLQMLDLTYQCITSSQSALKHLPALHARSHNLTVLFDIDQITIKVAPLTALNRHQSFWIANLGDPGVIDPAKIQSINIAITGFNQRALSEQLVFRQFYTAPFHPC